MTPLIQLLAPRSNKMESRLGLGPVKPSFATVAAKANLPGHIAYGGLQPKPVGHSAFTGGMVANPQHGLVQPAPPPPNPSLAPPGGGMHGGAAAASLAALGLLAGTPHGGAATSPIAPPPPGQPKPGPTGATTPPNPAAGTPWEPNYAPGGSASVPFSQGGNFYPGAIGEAWKNAYQNPDTPDMGIAPGGSVPTPTPTSALAALLAAAGVKANPSAAHTYLS